MKSVDESKREDTMEIKYKGTFELEYRVPEWQEDEPDADSEPCFFYNENWYFLSEFMSLHNKVHCPHCPERWKSFDGYCSDSFFSGYLVKLLDDDAVKLYLYIS